MPPTALAWLRIGAPGAFIVGRQPGFVAQSARLLQRK